MTDCLRQYSRHSAGQVPVEFGVMWIGEDESIDLTLGLG